MRPLVDNMCRMPDGILSADDLLRAIPEVTRELFVSAAMTNPTFVVDFLEDMLCSPDLSSWAKPCLWLLDSLFVGLEFDVTPHHFSKVCCVPSVLLEPI